MISQLDGGSPFSVIVPPSTGELGREGRVSYVLLSGRQDDGLWGPVGAVWLSDDAERGGFLVSPWALWEGSEIVRGYRSALRRGWTPLEIYGYWQREVWTRGYTVLEERSAESLYLLNELVSAL
ncbi:MAG TPA: hypothetical protein VFT27_08310 [Actinomycetota bacterium]|nr:hypothetical protein [Actinomycetota bacterium]